MEEYRAPWLEEGIITHSNGMAVTQISRISCVIRETEFKVSNPYIRNIILQNNIIQDNYDVVCIDDDHIKIYRKLMKYRKPVTNFLIKAKKLGYQTCIDEWQLKTCECMIKGFKSFNTTSATIGQINRAQEFSNEFLDTKIKVEIFKGGFTLSFNKIITD